MSTWAVLLAAGTGRRVGSPKQFLDIGGQRAVDRVVRTAAGTVDGIVLVLPAGMDWDGPPVDAVTFGGATRAQSVRAGLALVPAAAQVVVIHDAAHPLARERLFTAVIDCVLDGADAGVCVLPMTEVVQHVDAGIVTEVLPKGGQVLAQSPAAFRADVLRTAHATGADTVEDIGLVIALGARVATVPGEVLNLHVTTVEEWDIACALAPLLDDAVTAAPTERPT